MNLIIRPWITLATLALIAIASPRNTLAQSILDRIGGQVQEQLRQEVKRSIPKFTPPQLGPPRRTTPGDNVQVRPQGNSIPSEGGGQNNNSPFDPNAFFQPGSGGGSSPRPYTPPRSSQPGYQTPRYSNPSYGNPSYGNSPSTSTAYREPPVGSGDQNGGKIKIRCPKESPQSVTYKLVLGGKSYAYTMRPGESQSFAENQLWLIRYISGSQEVTYRVRGGNVYSFSSENGLTQLFRDPKGYHEFPEPPTRDSN